MSGRWLGTLMTTAISAMYARAVYRKMCKRRQRGAAAQRRCKAPVPPEGHLVELSHGSCYYVLEGEQHGGPLVVMVHGVVACTEQLLHVSRVIVPSLLPQCISLRSHPAAVLLSAAQETLHVLQSFRICAAEPLRDPIQALCKRRRVLRFDLGGRGFSSYGNADSNPHTDKFFAGQLAELLFVLGECEPIDIVGFSMGGLVAARFSATFPYKVRSAVLIAPPGTRYGPQPRWFPWFLALAPAGVTWLLARHMTSPEILGTDRWWESPPHNPDHHLMWEEHHARDARRSSVEPALPFSILSTWQHFPFNDAEDTFRLLGQHRHIPVLVMWGLHDRLISPKGAHVILDLMPRAQLWTIEKATHSLPMERYEEVSAKLTSWWRSCDCQGLSTEGKDSVRPE